MMSVQNEGSVALWRASGHGVGDEVGAVGAGVGTAVGSEVVGVAVGSEVVGVMVGAPVVGAMVGDGHTILQHDIWQ